MNTKLNLRQTLIDFLKALPEERFTARELASWMFDNLREACEEKRRNSQQDLANDAARVGRMSRRRYPPHGRGTASRQ